jgi:hypothetical protein
MGYPPGGEYPRASRGISYGREIFERRLIFGRFSKAPQLGPNFLGRVMRIYFSLVGGARPFKRR